MKHRAPRTPGPLALSALSIAYLALGAWGVSQLVGWA